ncbi:MAG: DMT family transporter [Anaerolineae bacterium]|nr:DMT family transporter [Anaerolineae bacterium]
MSNPANAVRLTTSQWWPYLIFGIGILAGSTGPIFLRLAQAEFVPSPIMTAFRLTIAALTFTPLVLRRYQAELRRLRKRDFVIALAAGGIFSIHFTFVFESYKFTSILIAGVLIGSIPLWTALIERFILHVHLGRTIWIGLGVALAGGAMISLSGIMASTDLGSGILIGGSLALTGAVLGAIYLVTGRTLRNHISFVPYVWLIFTSAAVISLLTVVVGGYSLSGYSPEGYFWVLMSTIFPQIIAHGSFNYVLAYLPATLISLSGQLTNVIGAAAAFFIFAELPGPLQIIGSAVIIVGVVMVIFGQSKE